MSNPVPSSLALTTIPDGSSITASPHRSNYTAIQAAVNEIIAALSNGTTGQFLQAADASDLVWGNAADKSSASSQVFTGNVQGPTLAATKIVGAGSASGALIGSTVGSPTGGPYSVGNVAIDVAGAIWVCTVAGSPGTWIQTGTIAPRYRSAVTALTYGTTVNIDASLGEFFTLTVTNGTAFTIASPTNPPDSSHTQTLMIEIFNNSGGAHGTISWGAAYIGVGGGVPTITVANTKRCLVQFVWNGANWVVSDSTQNGY